MKKNIVLIFWLLGFTNLYSQNNYMSEWESIDKRKNPTWFEDAKFGIFIHWGIYSVPSYSPTKRDGVGTYDRYAEWYWKRLNDKGTNQKYFVDFHNKNFGINFKYQDFVKNFKAEFFQPDDWAMLFKRSGAKYIVLSAKHHEGFTLWPSKYSWNWNSVDVGPHRDLLGDLSNSVKKYDLKMGYYYSLLEWYNPLYKKETISEYVNNHMYPQMKELVNLYNPDILWTDGEWDYTSENWKSTDFISWLFNNSSVKNDIVINDRWGKETRGKHGGFYTTEYDLINEVSADNVVFNKPWEECRGMAGSFGYNRNENLEDYSTSKELIHILINKVGRGGNLLLNIGPTADGRIPEIMQQRLLDIGDWLHINGEAIYETRKWENAPNVTKETSVYFTKKNKDLYVLCTKLPEEDIVINNISKPINCTMLGVKKNLKFSFKNKSLVIKSSKLLANENPSSFAWVYKLEGVLD